MGRYFLNKLRNQRDIYRVFTLGTAKNWRILRAFTMASNTKDFLSRLSIEITPKQAEKLPLIKENIPAGSSVYVAQIEEGDLHAQIEALVAIRAQGLEPIPHVPARFVKNRDALENRLKSYRDRAQVDHVLVLGGGAPEPVGDYDAAIQILETGLFQKYGVKKIGIAGHPEGNPDITKVHGEAVLLEALLAKQAYARENDLEAYIATQFLFEAQPVADWAKELKEAGVDLPIRVGVPGPATIKTLVRYAAVCGVGNSARFLRKQALNVTKLLTVNTPDKFVDELADVSANKPDLKIVGPHLYPFGGFDKLFAWLGPRMNG